jgi:hypothetical protein
MSRLKVLLLVVVAMALVFWTLQAGDGATRAAATQADAQLAQLEKGFAAALEAQPAHQRAVAAELTHHPAILSALAHATGKAGGVSLDDGPALKAAVEQALAQLPEADRAYAAAAMATSGGAVAVVPGHEAISASTFTWLDAALKAGATGEAGEVAGHQVWVYAAPVSAVADGKVESLGTLAVAYARDDAALQKLVDGFAPLTLVSAGKVIVSSDAAHAAAAAQVTAAGARALVSGQPESFLGLKLPLAPAPLVQARAFPVPGHPNVLAVATANLGPAASSAAEVQRRGLISLLGILLLGGLVAALSGSPKPATPELTGWSRADPAAVAPPAQPVSSAASAVAADEPAPAPLVALAELPAPVPKHAPAAAPPPIPAPAAADPVPGFDELFGSAPAAAPKPVQVETRAALVAAPPARKPAPPPTPPPSEPESERTGLMSRDMLSVLAAQSSIPQQDSAPIPLPGSSAAIPLPPAGGLEDVSERTSVAAVPLELLRAATRPTAAASSSSADGSEEAHFHDVYRDFVQTRERCGEPPENLSFEKFAAKLRKTKDQLMQKHPYKSVRFQVYVKEGKAALRATPVKEA